MTAPWPILTAIGVLGLAVGSFLNVVIYRVPRDESIVFPPSHCPTCGEQIKARHNVPVLSWLVLKGKCAYCTDGISVRYPLVEGGTAALFIAVTLRFGLTCQLPAYLYLAAVGVTLAMIDFDMRRLPDTIVLPSYVVSLLLLMPAGAVDASWWRAERALLGLLVLLTVFFALFMAYPMMLSPGDVKVAGLVGLYLGWLSWSAVAVGVLLSFGIAGFGGTAVEAAHRAGPGSSSHAVALPVGLCLVSATVLSLFVAAPITTWYGSLFTF